MPATHTTASTNTPGELGKTKNLWLRGYKRQKALCCNGFDVITPLVTPVTTTPKRLHNNGRTQTNRRENANSRYLRVAQSVKSVKSVVFYSAHKRTHDFRPHLSTDCLLILPAGKRTRRFAGWLTKHRSEIVDGKRFASEYDDHAKQNKWFVDCIESKR